MNEPGVLVGGRFRVGGRLGAGSQGEVYVVTDERTGTPGAIKIFDNVDAEVALAEVRTMARCRHPHVIDYRAAGLERTGPFAGRVWLAMDLADESLADRVERAGGTLAWSQLRPAVIGVLRGLAYLHGDEHQRVHRDIKPDNILAVGDTWVVADLGLTSRAGPGHGAASYTAPEVRAGQPASPRSDLWSLGAVILCCSTGRLPGEEGPGPEDPEAASVAAWLLAARPEDRPVSALDALLRLRLDELPEARTRSPECTETEALPLPPVLTRIGITSHRRYRAARRTIASAAAVLVAVGGVVAAVDRPGPATTTTAAGIEMGSGGDDHPELRPRQPPGGSSNGPVGGGACRNDFLGYQLTLPEGWWGNDPNDDYGPCQIVEPHPFDGRNEADPYPTVMFQTRARHEYRVDQGPDWTPAPRRIDGALARTFGPATDAYDTGTYRVYAVAIDRGPDVLIASLVGDPGETGATFDTKRDALDAMLATLSLMPSQCRQRVDPRCGGPYWTHQPPNPEMHVSLTAAPPNPTVGETVRFTIDATDDNADRLTVVWFHAGPRECPAPQVRDLQPHEPADAERAFPSAAAGPWDPPPPQTGHEQFTFTHTYDEPGSTVACAVVESAHSGSVEGLPDPYSNWAQVSIDIDVAPAATTTTSAPATSTPAITSPVMDEEPLEIPDIDPTTSSEQPRRGTARPDHGEPG